MDGQIARSCLRLGTHIYSKVQVPTVAQRSQLFTGYGSMKGGSLRGAGDSGGGGGQESTQL